MFFLPICVRSILTVNLRRMPGCLSARDRTPFWIIPGIGIDPVAHTEQTERYAGGLFFADPVTRQSGYDAGDNPIVFLLLGGDYLRIFSGKEYSASMKVFDSA